MKLGYICFESLHGNGILQAMVVTPMCKVKELGYFITILHFVKKSERNQFYYENKKNFSQLGISEIEINRCSNSAADFASAIFDQIKLFYYSFKLFRKNDLLHIRGYPPIFSCLILSYIFRKKIIFDPRGLFPEEAVFLGKISSKSFKYKFLKYLEKKIVHRASGIICINSQMKNYYSRLSSLNISKKIIILPNCSNCFVSEDNKSYKFEDSEFNLVYLGNAQSWHELEITIELMKRIKNELKCGIHFITNDISKIQSLIHDTKAELEPKIYSIGHKNLHQKLSLMDIGFCLRTKSMISEVAFPVKFSDMYSAGVSIIFDEHIGDLNKFNNNKFHIPINRDKDSLDVITFKILNQISLLRQNKNLKLSIANDFNKYLSWDSHIHKLLKLYDEIGPPN